MAKADIGLIGLAVMGQNLVLNMNDHGFTVAVFNRTVSKVDEFLDQGAKGTRIQGAHSLPELVGLLKRPRRVMLLVQAGPAVDDFIGQLIPLLEAGDIDHRRRQFELQRYDPPHRLCRIEGTPLHRHRRLGRRQAGNVEIRKRFQHTAVPFAFPERSCDTTMLILTQLAHKAAVICKKTFCAAFWISVISRISGMNCNYHSNYALHLEGEYNVTIVMI